MDLCLSDEVGLDIPRPFQSTSDPKSSSEPGLLLQQALLRWRSALHGERRSQLRGGGDLTDKIQSIKFGAGVSNIGLYKDSKFRKIWVIEYQTQQYTGTYTEVLLPPWLCHIWMCFLRILGLLKDFLQFGWSHTKGFPSAWIFIWYSAETV